MKILKRILLIFLVLAGIVVLAGIAMAVNGVALPRPTGPESTGRVIFRWRDNTRPEAMTDNPYDQREVVVEIWYPATIEGAPRPASYFPDLDRLQTALKESGEIEAYEQLGLPLVKTHSYENPALSTSQTRYPVLLFSPGNGTNGSFYTALVEELASHGYVVAVIEHPYDVSAVLLIDGQAAHFAWEKWPANDPGAVGGDRAVEEMIRERVAVRAADASFVLDRLEDLNASKTGQFAGRLDLARVGILGHSLGGMTAAQACQNDHRFHACSNLDGLVAGLPFFSGAQGGGLQQPFIFLTKTMPAPSKATLARLKVGSAEFQRRAQEAQERLASAMASVSSGSYQVVIEGATHESFGDGPLLLPAPLNPGAEKSLRITQIVRAYTLAFFENAFQGRPAALLKGGMQAFPEATLTHYPAK